MIVHRNRKTFFSRVLTDYIIIENLFYFLGNGSALKHSVRCGIFCSAVKIVIFTVKYFKTGFNAFVTDVHTRTGNKALYLVMAFSAE